MFMMRVQWRLLMRLLMRLQFGLLMGLFLVMGVARAENWYPLGDTGTKADDFKYAIDLDSIRLVEGRVRYWIKQDYASTQHQPGGRFITDKVLSIGDCRERIVAPSGGVYYDAQGQVVKTYSWRDRLNFRDITPGTVGEIELNFACAWAEGLRLPMRRNWEAMSNARFRLDADSLRTVNGWTLVWIKMKEDASAAERLFYDAVDCAGQRWALIWAGGEKDSIHLKPRSEWELEEAGSLGDAICKRAAAPVAPKSAPPKLSQPKAAPPAASAAEKAGSTGSGFVVDKQGTVVTNQHVVEDCSRIEVRHQGQKYPAKLVKADKNIDLAILRIKPGLPTATLRREPVEVGQSVFVAGFPLAGLLSSDMNFTPGMVSSLAGIKGDITELQITAPVQPGNSGGPLLDDAGQVTGVVVSKLDALVIAEKIGDIPQNVNFAIKTDMLRLFLDSNRIAFEATAAAPRDPVQIANKARGFTVQVVCE